MFWYASENSPNIFSKFNIDHPSMLGALGILPGESIDHGIMLNTLHAVLREWEFDRTWGWDFPMIAMTAARLAGVGGSCSFDGCRKEYIPYQWA